MNKPPTEGLNPLPDAPRVSSAKDQALDLRACTNQLREAITANLHKFEAKTASPQAASALRRAAVALTVTEVGPGADLSGIPQPTQWSSQPGLILTR